MRIFLFSTLLSLAVSTSHADEAAWKIPSPATTAHPASVEAPASSPQSYPDEEKFQQRARQIITDLAKNDLAQWRRGYFAGGDPGKYLPAAAAAKLLLDPANEEARRYMNDDRSYKEQYHFSSLNWTRFLPLFGERVLSPETRKKTSDAAFRADAYLDPRGTENHKTMWWTSANVLPHYLDKGVAHKNKEASLAQSKKMLRDYVKGLYTAGQGEWDSSTYLMFDVNGMLNIYDFSPDPEARLLAKAALDWFIAGYALKYRDGVYTSPNQRGYAEGPHQTIADQTGWLWWGSNAEIEPGDTTRWFYTWHAATSGWRPNKVLSNIATKRISEPVFEARNTKPNYWHGQNITPKAGEYFETIFNGRTYTLGSLWNGFGGQTTRMQLVAESPSGGVVFTGGHPRKSDHTGRRLDEITYKDGGGRYDQSAQIGGAYVSMTRVPEDEPLEYSFFSIPEGATPPVKKGNWLTMRVGETFSGLHSLGGEAVIGQSDLSEKQKEENDKALAKGQEAKHKAIPIIRFPGRNTGFILQTASARDTHFILQHEAAFKPVNPKVPVPTTEQLYDEFGQRLQTFSEVDVSRWDNHGELRFRAFDGMFPNEGGASLNGTIVMARYQPDKNRAAVYLNGQPMSFDHWPIYNSRYVNCADGVLSVNDGESGYIVDFSDEMPVYKSWQKEP